MKSAIVIPVVVGRGSDEPLRLTDFIPDEIEPYVLKIINFEIFNIPVWQIILIIAAVDFIIRWYKTFF